LAVVAALVGALIILRPGLREVLPGHVAQLGAALFFGAAYLVAKRLTGFASASAIVANMTLIVTLCLAPFAIAVWQPISGVQVLWLGATAVFATIAHYCMTRAFQCAPVSVTQPVVFLQLVWASSAGWLLFEEAVDPFVMLGGALIIASVTYLSWREAQLKRRAARAAKGQGA
jgi:drug/metabolite transporter (DMT)-like permease